jgi:integrase
VSRTCLQTILAPSSQLSVCHFPPNSPLRREIEIEASNLYRCAGASFNGLPDDILIFLFYCAVSSARASELLKLTIADSIGCNRYLVRGAKGSSSFIVVFDSRLVFPNLSQGFSPRTRIFNFSYKNVWRWSRRAGIGFASENGVYLHRTHAHRYHTASAVSAIADRKTAGQCLHHKNANSIDYYIV